jgi:hypothetical protein
MMFQTVPSRGEGCNLIHFSNESKVTPIYETVRDEEKEKGERRIKIRNKLFPAELKQDFQQVFII